MAGTLANLLTFYGELGRPLTAIELWRLSKRGLENDGFQNLLAALDNGIRSGTLKEEEGFFSLKEFGLRVIDRKKQDLLLDKKWKRVSQLARFFKFLPFIDFAVINGSMALGTVTANSDFDVLIGARAGKIFTARYIALFLFSFLGARRLDDSSGSGPDKFCFNHFVTEGNFVKPPFNYYRRELYKTMVPVYGRQKDILKFVSANSWSGLAESALKNLRYEETEPSRLKILLENFLSGFFGKFLESSLKSIAVRRLFAYAKKRAGGRVVIKEAELEFHFNLSGEEKFARLIPE